MSNLFSAFSTLTNLTDNVSVPAIDPVTGQSLHPGMKTFRDCLNVSLENYDFFIRNRVEGATKFLNVLQGRNESEGDIWWEAVKDLPFETWAFSNVQASNFSINLRRLIIMRDGKYLDANGGVISDLGAYNRKMIDDITNELFTKR